MEAPEKIYVHVKKDKVTNTWNSTWKGVCDIEYVHKDAFIEKAEKFLNDKFGDVVNVKVSETLTKVTTRQDFIEHFKKYMED